MRNTVKKSRHRPLLVTSDDSSPLLYWQGYVNFWAISAPGILFGLKRETAAIQSKVRLKMIHYRALKITLILIHTEIKHKHYKFT